MTQWFRIAAMTALVTAAGMACAPVRARPETSVALRCDATETLHWAAGPRGGPRRLPVRLEVLPEASAAWRLDGRSRLDDALGTWNRAGVPIRLARAEPADSVAIRVIVMRRLPLDPSDGNVAYRAGVTHLRYDPAGAIAGAQVLIAEETPRGEPYSSGDQRATLMHELGHALGVPHSDHPFALMSARATAVTLTPHDLALARQVYDRRACAGGRTAITASRGEG